MKEQLIEFETAKLAKEKGFDCKCLNYWGINHIAKLRPELNSSFNRHTNNYNGHEFRDQCYSAPTQSLLQKWLREKHSIFIYVNYPNRYDNDVYLYRCVQFPEIENDIVYETFEQALEKGLFEALNLIK